VKSDHPPKAPHTLTSREQEVLSLAAKGNANRETAAQLEISTETVKKHLKNIYSKLNVRNKIEAMNKIQIR
jgi:DNA-binding NarL/FixJ family response regulator